MDGTVSWGDERPSDRAGPGRFAHGPRRVALLSVHSSPLEQPGSGDSGGMTVYVMALARHLAATGTAVDVYTRSTGADLPPTVPLGDGIRVHHVEAGAPGLSKSDLASNLCAFYLGLSAHPAVATADLVHGHYWMGGWVGRRVARRLDLPLVQTFHTLGRVKNETLAPGDTPEPQLRLAAEDRIVADADAILAATSEEAAVLRERYDARRGSVHVVEPGVDLSIFRPDGSANADRHATRQALGGGRILLFAGRLQPLKGPDVAIRTLAALDAHVPDDGVPTRLLVVGGASGSGIGTVDPPALRRLAEQLGVADRVAFLAPRSQVDLAALYRAADVVLMPSRSESYGLVALEAQACGTPVVAADVGGLRRAVGGAGGGRLVTGYHPDDWAAAAAPYLLDARERAAASAAGIRRASGASWEAAVDRVTDIYALVLAGRERSGAVSSARGA